MILVTGGEGYLGSRIVNYLRLNGLQVRVGGREEKRGVVKIDLSDEDSLKRACAGAKYIIHLAAMNSNDCAMNAEQALLINSLGTLRLLNVAKKSKVIKFLYFSTVHVYGSSLAGEIDEKSATNPLHHYSITHRIAEDYVRSVTQNSSMSGTVFRLTNAVGSPARKNTNCWMLIVNDICKQAVVNKKMDIYSDEFTHRDFISISEICSAVLFTLQSDSLDRQTVNLSSALTTTLQGLTNIIVSRSERVLGYIPEVNFVKGRKRNKKKKLIVSNLKLKELGFTVDSDISNEIDRLLLNCKQWFKE
jgi:UDP-glucose 4-epimerase